MVEIRTPFALNLSVLPRGVLSVTVGPSETGSEENTGILTDVPGAFMISQVGIRYRGMEIAVGCLLSHN